MKIHQIRIFYHKVLSCLTELSHGVKAIQFLTEDCFTLKV